MTTTSRILHCMCPHCGYAVCCITSVHGNQKPTPGDISLCFYCGAVNVFAADLSIRSASPLELSEFMSDEETCGQIQRAQALIRKRGALPEKEGRA